MRSKTVSEPVPYITNDGKPIHLISEAEQRGYMASFSVEQRNQVVEAANRLHSIILGKTQQRSELKRQSREKLKISSEATQEQRDARFQELDKMRQEYEKLATDIEKLKSTEFKLDAEGNLVIPPFKA